MIPRSTFGRRLRSLRQTLGISQVELARRIGRHQTVIGPYERDEYEPSREVVEKLAAAPTPGRRPRRPLGAGGGRRRGSRRPPPQRARAAHRELHRVDLSTRAPAEERLGADVEAGRHLLRRE